MDLPSLSQIRAWSSDHLNRAASQWDYVGDLWQDSFHTIRHKTREVGWSGDAAEAAQNAASRDHTKVLSIADDLRSAAAAARGAVAPIEAAKIAALNAVGEAHAEGFVVEEDLNLTDRLPSTPPAEMFARHLQSLQLSREIKQRAAKLASVDAEAAQRIRAITEGLRHVPFGSGEDQSGEHNSVQLIDYHNAPPPEKPSWTSPEPPGGWSDDPITRAAQKIAYGHASNKHLAAEWPPNTTREDLAREVERMMRASMKPDGGMIVGRTVDNAPAIYDPRTNTLIIRDPGAADAGTVFRPTRGEAYVADKVPARLPSLSAAEIADAPSRPPVESPRLPRVGMPPMVGIPPMAGAPEPGAGDVPVLDSGGAPDVGLPGAGR